jgi:hypothetical protein
MFENFNPSLTILSIEMFELRNGKFVNGGADDLSQRGTLGEGTLMIC